MMKLLQPLFIVILFISLSFAQTYVPPGEATLSTAIDEALDGEVLQLVPGGVYTESELTEFGTIVDMSITIEAEEGGEEMPRVQLLTSSDESLVFFLVGDKGSLTLKGIDFDGSIDESPTVTNLVKYYMGDIPAPATINKVDIQGCYIHDFAEDVIAAGNSDMIANVVVDSTLIDNTVTENTGTIVYYKYGGSNYIGMTNSTFNTINSYGIRIAGPGENALPDNTPTVLIDHTTWYNIGTEDGREVIQGEKGPLLNPWKVSNSIFVKQVEKTRTVINIKDMPTPDLAVINNICLWDVGKRTWFSHPVTDTLNIDPEFADTLTGDFTLPVGSPLLTFADDGGAIGDPRWAINGTSVEKETQPAPTVFALHQNYPNPFNPVTAIRYSLPSESDIEIAVYDALGKKITTLQNVIRQAGYHTLTWNAADQPSGIYYLRLMVKDRIAETSVLTRKMIVIK